jgi:hypothetical protein
VDDKAQKSKCSTNSRYGSKGSNKWQQTGPFPEPHKTGTGNQIEPMSYIIITNKKKKKKTSNSNILVRREWNKKPRGE